MNGKWYIGTMNDGLFIIDQPPQPAPVDYACGMNHDVNVIAAMGNDKVRAEAIVTAHNEAITKSHADAALRVATLQGIPGWGGLSLDEQVARITAAIQQESQVGAFPGRADAL